MSENTCYWRLPHPQHWNNYIIANNLVVGIHIQKHVRKVNFWTGFSILDHCAISRLFPSDSWAKKFAAGQVALPLHSGQQGTNQFSTYWKWKNYRPWWKNRGSFPVSKQVKVDQIPHESSKHSTVINVFNFNCIIKTKFKS